MLADRGLPHNVFEIFVRAPERELEVAELPGCGRAAILAQYIDDWIIYWLGLADGSIWMTKGDPGQPAENIEKINTTVTGLQKVLAAWCDLKSSGITENNDPRAYEDLVAVTNIRAVSADPAIFEDEQGWWPVMLEELDYTLPRLQSGRWVLDHPGYDEDDES